MAEEKEIIEEEIYNGPKYTKKYSATDDTLTVTDTPDRIIETVKVYNIKDIKAQIARYQRARGQWEDKISPLQAIVDKHEEIKSIKEK